PSKAIGATGTSTRTRATCMSSGPAISRMNGTIDSATCEPSRGTSARLYMSGSPGRLRAARDFERCGIGADDENRDVRAAQDRLGHAAEDQAPETAAAMGGHHDHVSLLRGCGLHDRGGGRAVPDVRLDA